MIDGNDRENFTKICTVAAVGAKLSMGTFAKGRAGGHARGASATSANTAATTPRAGRRPVRYLQGHNVRRLRAGCRDDGPIWLMPNLHFTGRTRQGLTRLSSRSPSCVSCQG
jgi:hypothetical protein